MASREKQNPRADVSMKKTFLALGVLSSFAASVHAQSGVTLFGVIDEGINYISNAGGHRQYSMSSGVLQGSRWCKRRSNNGPLKRGFAPEKAE